MSHSLTLKSLTQIHFTAADSKDDAAGKRQSAEDANKSTRVCPSCSRPLTNSSHAILAKPCGHVVCGPCVDKFIRTGIDESVASAMRCYVCSEDLGPRDKDTDKHKDRTEKGKKDKEKDKNRGLVEISSEGTGFASGGMSEVQRQGISFQC